VERLHSAADAEKVAAIQVHPRAGLYPPNKLVEEARLPGGLGGCPRAKTYCGKSEFGQITLATAPVLKQDLIK
jgi:hypothetical protein